MNTNAFFTIMRIITRLPEQLPGGCVPPVQAKKEERMNNSLTTVIIAVLVLAFAGLLLWALLVKLSQFREELEYINMELRRATAENRKYWKKRRRQLFLSLLPFYRRQ